MHASRAVYPESVRVRRNGHSSRLVRWHLLLQARQLVAAGKELEANTAVRDVFVGCISDVTDKSAASLTSRELKQKLSELGVDDALCGEIADLLERCEVGRYSAATGSTSAEVNAAEQLLVRLSKSLNECGLLS